MNSRILIIVVLLLYGFCANAIAHSSNPFYLEITQAEEFIFDARWKVPLSSDKQVDTVPRWPDSCRLLGGPTSLSLEGATLQTSRWLCQKGLNGLTLSIDGLNNSRAEAIIVFRNLNGEIETHTARSFHPDITFGANTKPTLSAFGYFISGIEHILLGIDHLLFVAALMLLIQRWLTLIKTITAFTIAHSITLIAGALSWISLPSAPVEAIIALSILFLAREYWLKRNGQITLSISHPWLVALLFGLVHGLGFAGALQEVGIPDEYRVTALLLFNLGVEAGQLMFICAVLGVMRVYRLISDSQQVWQMQTVNYAIGSIAAFWMIQRLANF